MKKLFILFLFIFTFYPFVNAEETKLLTAEVSMVPKSFYGTWRVLSKRVDTTDPSVFKENGLDIWNLSRTYDVITLCNLFNGAKADIIVKKVNANNIVFTKEGKYDKKVLSDRVELNLNEDTFTGTDTLQLDTYSQGKIIKTETAIYKLKGEKISGEIK